ncbi:MAG: hypothetical protein ACREF3_11440 [Acetobacteraceae bacterium]
MGAAAKASAAVAVLLLVGIGANAAQQRGTQFWNLTGQTITHLYLAPSGTDKWGTDQTRNDPDGSVDDDERLAITGVGTGHYDAKLTQQNGRICMARNIAVKRGGIFSIDKKTLSDCKP